MMIFAQAAAVAAPWAQFGLAGLVISALFGVLTFFIKSHTAERKEQEELHRKDRQASDTMHRSERLEWREEASKREDAARQREEGLQAVMTELQQTIREVAPSRNHKGGS